VAREIRRQTRELNPKKRGQSAAPFSFNLGPKTTTLTKVKVETLDSRYLIGQDEDVHQALHLEEIDPWKPS
jgi:hypothetical protein